MCLLGSYTSQKFFLATCLPQLHSFSEISLILCIQKEEETRLVLIS
jgi:hypothetical protein